MKKQQFYIGFLLLTNVATIIGLLIHSQEAEEQAARADVTHHIAEQLTLRAERAEAEVIELTQQLERSELIKDMAIKETQKAIEEPYEVKGSE